MTELNSRAFSDSLYYERCSCLALLARLKNAKTPDLEGNGPEGVRHNTVMAAVFGRNNNDHVTALMNVLSGRSNIRKDETQQWKLVAGEMVDMLKMVRHAGNLGMAIKSYYKIRS